MKIADLEGVTRSNIYNVPPNLIHTLENSRRYPHSDSQIAELAADMAERGQLVPVRIRRDKEENLILIDGERRLKAALYINQMGLTEEKFKLACILTDADELASFEQSLVSNLKRQGLSPIDLAHAMSRLEELGKTRKEIQRAVGGKSAAWVSETLSLLKLPQKVQRMIHEGKMAATAGLEIARLPDDQIAPAVERIFSPLEPEPADPVVPAGRGTSGGTDDKPPRREKRVTQREVKRVKRETGVRGKREKNAPKPRSLKEIRNFFLGLESSPSNPAAGLATAFLHFMDGRVTERGFEDAILLMLGFKAPGTPMSEPVAD